MPHDSTRSETGGWEGKIQGGKGGEGGRGGLDERNGEGERGRGKGEEERGAGDPTELDDETSSEARGWVLCLMYKVRRTGEGVPSTPFETVCFHPSSPKTHPMHPIPKH